MQSAKGEGQIMHHMLVVCDLCVCVYVCVFGPLVFISQELVPVTSGSPFCAVTTNLHSGITKEM